MSENVAQISDFLKNEPGSLGRVTDTLKKAGIDLRALTVCESEGFGILRMIVSDPESTIRVLNEAGYTSKQTEVLAVEIGDRPGGLNALATITGDAGINIDYLYVFVTKTHRNAVAIIRTDKNNEARSLLTSKGMHLIEPEKLYSI